MSEIRQFNLPVQSGKGDVANVPYPTILKVDGVAHVEYLSTSPIVEYTLIKPEIQPYYAIWDLGNLQSGVVNLSYFNKKLPTVTFATANLAAFITAQQAILDAEFGAGVMTLSGSNQRRLRLQAQADDPTTYSIRDSVPSSTATYLANKITADLYAMETGNDGIWSNLKAWFSQGEVYLRTNSNQPAYTTVQVTLYPPYYFDTVKAF